MRTLASLRKKAEDLFGQLSNPHMFIGTILDPTTKFVHELRGALHEGTVGKQTPFWQSVVNGVLKEVASDEKSVKLIVGSEHSLYEQVKKLVDELEAFPKRSLIRGHNRYALVTAFCKSLARPDHHGVRRV